MSKPPPPRYRIVERDGRLITIDTWAKTPPPPLPTLPSTRAAPRSRNAADRPPAGVPRPGRVPAWFDSIGAAIVAVLLKIRDDSGRRVLTTDPAFDRRGPRIIALSPAAERRLGRVLALAALAAALCLAGALFDVTLLLALLVVAVLVGSSLASVGGGPVTRFLDSLDDDLPR